MSVKRPSNSSIKSPIKKIKPKGNAFNIDSDYIPNIQDLTPLYEGETFLKFGRNGKAHERLVQLTRDNRYIVWTSPWWTLKGFQQCEVPLNKVKRIQQGQWTAPFQARRKHYGNSRLVSFSLIYDNGGDRSLDLIAPKKSIFELWYVCLRYLIEVIKNQRENIDIYRKFLRAKWEVADLDHNGSVSLSEVKTLINTFGLNKPSSTIKKMFLEVDGDGNGKLNFEEFCRLMEILCRRPDLEYMWNLIVTNQWDTKATITPLGVTYETDDTLPKRFRSLPLDKFMTYWNETQDESLSKSDIISLINEVRTTPLTDTENIRISYNLWVVILTHRKNDAFDPAKQVIYQSMDYPLSHYYISSSHNTYLEGDQILSFSSVNRYASDFFHRCRCVELDCWDGDNGEPIIYHGHTYTSKILFKDVIIGIKKEAFRNSPYPVILSIENHCSLDQQKRMATRFKVVFGKMLLRPKELVKSDGFGFLPTVNDLQYRILIKGKRNEIGFENDDSEDENDEDVDDISVNNNLSCNEEEERIEYLEEFPLNRTASSDSDENRINRNNSDEQIEGSGNAFMKLQSKTAIRRFRAASRTASMRLQAATLDTIEESEEIEEDRGGESKSGKTSKVAKGTRIITYRDGQKNKSSSQQDDTLLNGLIRESGNGHSLTNMVAMSGTTGDDNDDILRQSSDNDLGSDVDGNNQSITSNTMTTSTRDSSVTGGSHSDHDGNYDSDLHPPPPPPPPSSTITGDTSLTTPPIPPASPVTTTTTTNDIKDKDSLYVEEEASQRQSSSQKGNEEVNEVEEGGGGKGVYIDPLLQSPAAIASAKEMERRMNKVRLLGVSRKSSFSTLSSRTVGGTLKTVKKEFMHPDLSDITYLGGIKYVKSKGFLDASVPCDLMSSFKETTLNKLVADKNVGKLWMRHNIRHMSRIYPKGSRIDSSNMDPFPAWCVGCQMVALNYQTAGLYMQLNDGKFRENGNCGYVLKPPYMRFDSHSPKSPVRVTIHLLSAQNLPRPSGSTREKGMNPYVLVSVHGVVDDSSEYRSRTIRNNGFNPIWDEVCTFDISTPEMAIICFRVYFLDNLDSSDFVAYASIPITCLRKGFRCLRLYDYFGNQLGDFDFATVLVRISILDL